MIRVLHLVYEDIVTPTGGLGVHCRGLPKALGLSGGIHNTVCAISQSWDRGYAMPYAPGVDLLYVAHVGGWFSETGLEFQHSLEHDYICTLLAHIPTVAPYDLIHIHDSHLWRVAIALQTWLHLPIVMTSHLSPLLHGLTRSPHLVDAYRCQMEGDALCGSAMVLTISQDYTDGLRRIFGDNIPMRQIGNGVDFEELSQVRPDPVILNRLKFTNGNPIICMVGRLTPQKGIEQFMAAARVLPDHNFVLICHLAKAISKVYPLAERVIAFEKSTPNFEWVQDISWEDKYRLMASCAVGCMPSTFEPFGIAALEWMALRIPLIVSDVGGLREMCSPRNAVMIPPGDVNALVAAIGGLPPDAGRIACAYETARGWSWSKVALNTLAAYQEVLRWK